MPHGIDSSRARQTGVPHKGLLGSLRHGLGSRFLEAEPVSSTPGTINPWHSLPGSTSGSLPPSL